MTDKKQDLQNRMEHTSTPLLVLSFALPCAVSMTVVSLYSLADSYFVSTLSKQASAAVASMFALQILLQTVGYTLGMGSGSLLSRALGKGDRKAASLYASSALLYALLVGAAITLLCLLFQEKLIFILGVDKSIYPDAKNYAVPLFWSAIPTCASFVLTQLLRAEGYATVSMWGQIVGCAVNVVLDPLLIHTLGLGTAGASVATLLAHCATCGFLLRFYLSKKQDFRLFQEPLPRLLTSIGRIVPAGLPSFFRQGLSGVATVLFNHAALRHGPSAITALSTVNRIFLFVFAICLGFGQGLMPVAGYRYGAGDPSGAKRAYGFSAVAATLSTALVSLPLFLFSKNAVAVFSGDEEVIRLGSEALRAVSALLFSHGLVTCTVMYLQAIGSSTSATLLACARQGIFFLPLLFLLPVQFGWSGLVWVQPAADAATLLFAIPFALTAMKAEKKPPQRLQKIKKGTPSV